MNINVEEIKSKYEAGSINVKEIVDIVAQLALSKSIDDEAKSFIEWSRIKAMPIVRKELIPDFEQREKEIEQNIANQLQLGELESWFSVYDLEVSKYEREMRVYRKSDIDIIELDKQAEINRTKVRELRAIIKG